MDKNTLAKLHKVQIEILDEIVKICTDNNLEYFLIGGTLLGAIRHGGFIPWDDDLDIAMPRESYEKFLEICKTKLNKRYELDSYKNNPKYWLPFVKVRKKNTVYEEMNVSKLGNFKTGIWVDIFPLDNVKKELSFLQSIQAKLVKNIRGFITIKQGYIKTDSNKRKILYRLFKYVSVNKAFVIQNTLMKIWNSEQTNYLVNLGSQYNYKKQTIHKDKYFPLTKVNFEGNEYYAPNDWDYILKRIYGDYMVLPPENKRVTHNPVRIKFEGEDEIS